MESREEGLARRSGGPWTFADLVRTGACALLGLTGIALCWNGAASSKVFERQLLWTAFAMISLGVGVTGGALWIVTGLKVVRTLRRDLLQIVAARTAPARSTQAATAQSVVIGDAMTRFHLADCPFARGKSVRTTTRPLATRAGLRPCEVCKP